MRRPLRNTRRADPPSSETQRDAAHLLSPEQCRAARAALKWTVIETYRVSTVSNTTLVKFEAGGKVREDRVGLLRAAFEARGITFAPDGRGVSW